MTEKEQALQILQQLSAQAREIIDQMTTLAQANGITSVPFLDGVLQFGVEFAGRTYPMYSDPPDGREFASNLTGYYPAAGGALMTDGEWSASHFECWPYEEQKRWLYGEDPSKWAKTDYED